MNEKLGATGQFPDGKVQASDEGELRFAVGEEHGNVMVRFGKPVAWLAMPPEQAVAFAQLLIAKARMLAKRQGKPLAVTLSVLFMMFFALGALVASVSLGAIAPSASGAMLTAPTTQVLTDSVGNTWGIDALPCLASFGAGATARVTKNGVPDTSTCGIIEIAYVNGVIWSENGTYNWYPWTGSKWGAATVANPLPPPAVYKAVSGAFIGNENGVLAYGTFNGTESPTGVVTAVINGLFGSVALQGALNGSATGSFVTGSFLGNNGTLKGPVTGAICPVTN